MSNIPALLAELSEIATQICQRKETEFAGTWYKIGDYEFGQDLWVDGEFLADYPNCMVRGQPALDWLQGALKSEFERQKIAYEMSFWTYNDELRYRVYDVVLKENHVFDNLAEALLTTLIAAIRQEGE